MGMEDKAYILDYLPHGRTEDTRPIYKKEPVAYGLGKKYFSLIELVPKKNVDLNPQELVYIGKESRDKIEYIKRRVRYEDISSGAKSELPYVVEKVVKEREKEYLEFFNKVGPISTRLHQLELLPGIGKKLMWEILDERKKEPFKSFEDISSRIKSLSDPGKLITKRIVMEIEEEGVKTGKGKYRIFVPSGPRRER